MFTRKKLSKKDKDKLAIAVIIVSLIICVLCIGGDLIKAVPDAVKSEMSGIVGDVGNAVDATGEVIGRVELIGNLDEDKADIAALDIVEIVRVADGDTYVLDIDGEETKVRLIGVDTPESVAPASYHKENTSEGRLVSEVVKEKLATVPFLYIEYDVERTDKYGRTLAYLYFPDGTMVQDWLLENGYADIATYAPNTKYAEHFKDVVASRDEKEAA